MYQAIVVLLLLFLVGGVLALWLLRGALGRSRSRRRYTEAHDAFFAHRQELEGLFFKAASGLGKPRGLAWRSCDFGPRVLFSRDRVTGDIYALVRVTIAFEPIAGGGMEDVAAAGDLRCASALFEWRDATWTTTGRAIFNLEPREAVAHYQQSLEIITEAPATDS